MGKMKEYIGLERKRKVIIKRYAKKVTVFSLYYVFTLAIEQAVSEATLIKVAVELTVMNKPLCDITVTYQLWTGQCVTRN